MHNETRTLKKEDPCTNDKDLTNFPKPEKVLDAKPVEGAARKALDKQLGDNGLSGN